MLTSSDRQCLIVTQKHLEGEHILSDYDAQQESALRLLHCGMQIFIRTLTKKTIIPKVEVESSDTVGNVKAETRYEEGESFGISPSLY